MARLEDPLRIGNVEVRNRLYRAPILECAGNGPDAARILREELAPSAASGVGLIMQGASLVTAEGGRTAPGLSRVHDPDFVRSLEPVTEAIHAHGARIFMQIGHGGLQTMETWHRPYAADHPDLEQLCVSEPPWILRWLHRLGVLELTPRVLTTDEVHELAEAFGRCAGYAVDAGYDGIHLSGANASIIQQFLSPFFNERSDEFGGDTPEARARFLEIVHDNIREHAGNVPLVTKVPAETAAPRIVRNHLTIQDGTRIARHLETVGYDAVVPVQVSVLREASVARGAYPELAWQDERFQERYDDVFGSPLRKRILRFLNRFAARRYRFEPAWNTRYQRAVSDTVDIPVLGVGGIRERSQMDELLASGTCDLVGMARPFYAEPRLAARILRAEPGSDTRVLCASCNNCTIPQVTGAPGVCRTPAVVRERVRYERQDAYQPPEEVRAG